MLDILIVAAIVLLAAVYVFRRFAKSASSEGSGCGCGDGGGCGGCSGSAPTQDANKGCNCQSMGDLRKP